jgi:hypothetical protein
MTENADIQPVTWLLRGGSRHGTKHIRLNQSNQDAFTMQCFSVPSYQKNYHVGLVSDGCSGNPAFSHTEGVSAVKAAAAVQAAVASGEDVL